MTPELTEKSTRTYRFRRGLQLRCSIASSVYEPAKESTNG